MFVQKNEAEQTGEVSMKKNQRVGGMCERASVRGSQRRQQPAHQ